MPSHTTEVYQDENAARQQIYKLRENPLSFNVRLIRSDTVAFFDMTSGATRRINDNLPENTVFYLVQYEDTQSQPQPPSQENPAGESVTIA